MKDWKVGDVAWVCYESYDCCNELFSDIHLSRHIVESIHNQTAKISDFHPSGIYCEKLFTREQAIAEIKRIDEFRQSQIAKANAAFNKSRDEALAKLAQ